MQPQNSLIRVDPDNQAKLQEIVVEQERRGLPCSMTRLANLTIKVGLPQVKTMLNPKPKSKKHE